MAEAKKIYSLNEIKYNEKNKALAMVSCIPLVGLIMLFVEKKDLFVRYHAAQFAFFNLILLVGIIPIIGWILSPILGIMSFIAFIIGLVKISGGNRFDIPVLSGWGLKLMSATE
ncbi:MAG: DUF4870 domain-containing protein [Candidatus Dojkabacteria bacterium]